MRENSTTAAIVECIPGTRRVALACAQCGKSFEWPRSRYLNTSDGGNRPVFCSIECRAARPVATIPRRDVLVPKLGRVAVVCQGCKVTFYVPPCQADRRKYCSRDCASGQQITKECRACGKPYAVPLHRGRASRYCSEPCKRLGSRGHRVERVERICEHCGAAFTMTAAQLRHNTDVVRGRPYRKGTYCSKVCSSAARSGPNHWNWKGGRYYTDNGYVVINRDGESYLEHRMVATEMLGRPLDPDEDVHHRNRVKDDNRPENLLVIGRDTHTRLHNIEDQIAYWRALRELADDHLADLAARWAGEVQAAESEGIAA